jgi:hypothetical protein
MAINGATQDPHQAEIDEESDYEIFEHDRNFALSGRLFFSCHSSREKTRKLICEHPLHFYFSNAGPEVCAPHTRHLPGSPHDRS